MLQAIARHLVSPTKQNKSTNFNLFGKKKKKLIIQPIIVLHLRTSEFYQQMNSNCTVLACHDSVVLDHRSEVYLS